jgi:hypothetical protein
MCLDFLGALFVQFGSLPLSPPFLVGHCPTDTCLRQVDYGDAAEQHVRSMTAADRRKFVEDTCSFFKYTFMTWMNAPKCGVCVDAPATVASKLRVCARPRHSFGVQMVTARPRPPNRR